MPLSKHQLGELRSMIQPIIDETIADSVREAIEQAIKGEMRSGPASYIDKVLGQHISAGARRAKELPHAAKVFARLGLIAATYQGDRALALDMAKVLDIEGEYKSAMSAGSGVGGGFLLADDMADDIIELLRPYSVMRRIGAIEVPIPRGTMRTPRIDVGVSSGYVAEGRAIPASALKTGQVVLVGRKLATLVVLSNELSTFSADVGVFNADQVILNDMLASMGQVEDDKFLRGSGAQAEPLGIVNQVASTNKFNANATINVANVVADLGKAITKLRTANVKFVRPVWIFSGRTEVFLQTLLDSNNNFVFRSEIENGRLLRWPFHSTENIPSNLGAGTDESLIILADASEIMLGDVNGISVDRSDSATVKIDGVDTNLFETDRRAIRVRRWNDIQLRHEVGIAVIEQVKWGA